MGDRLSEKSNLTLEELEASSSQLRQEIDASKSKLETGFADELACRKTFEKIKSGTDNRRQLAGIAIQMLSDHCPVCDQKIDMDVVHNKLEIMIGEQNELVIAKAKMDETIKYNTEIKNVTSQLQFQYEKLIADIERLKKWQKQTDRLYIELQEICAKLALFNLPSPIPGIYSIVEWISRANNWKSDTLAKIKSIELYAQKVLDARSVIADSEKLQLLDAYLERVINEYNEQKEVTINLEKHVKSRKGLIELAKNEATHVVRDTFEILQPVIQDLFCRLAPHPTFNKLSFTHELYRKRGSSVPLAIDQLAEQAISPALGFSSAQANVAALCYFIGLAFASSEADFGFVLLDDPLQAMDDINALGFSDLCRFLRKEKQLIIATHEDRLSSLLLRKLRSRNENINTISLNFTSWNRSGPSILVERIVAKQEKPILASLS